jgi:hypothetical protein
MRNKQDGHIALPDGRVLLLLLLAGGGWEGVKLLIFLSKSDPTPTLSCEQGREQFEAGLSHHPRA